MAITPLPTPPLRSDGPTSFADRGDTFMAALPAFVAEANALEANVDALEASAVTAASTATTKATEASASAAAAAANSAAPQWVSGTTYAIGDVRWSPIDGLAYRKMTAAAGGAVDPSVNAADWVLIYKKPQINRSARTSNTVLGAADNGTLIDITSGTFTQTFAACATLGSGWYCYLKNSGTGNITLDPNGAELIDGLTSFVMYPGEVRLVQCDGAALRTTVVSPFFKPFLASGTFSKPPGYASFGIYMCAAGGGGGGGRSGTGSQSIGSGGGGGGAALQTVLPASNFSATETATCGLGGAGGASGNNAGVAGGNTTFLGVTVFGGGGGTSGSSNSGAGGGWLSAAIGTTAGTGSVLLFDSGVASAGSSPSVYGGSSGGSGGSSAGVNPGTAGVGSRFGGGGGGGSGSTRLDGAGAGGNGTALLAVSASNGGAVSGAAGTDETRLLVGGSGGGSFGSSAGNGGKGGNGGPGSGGGGGGGAYNGTGGAGGAGGDGFVMVWGIS